MSNIIQYTGSPKEPNKKDELTKWQRFWKVCMPWLSKKAEMVDGYAEAVLEGVKIQNALNQAQVENLKEQTALLAEQKAKAHLEAIEKALDVETKIQSLQKTETIDAKGEVIEEIKNRLSENIQKLKLSGGSLLAAGLETSLKKTKPKSTKRKKK